MKKIFLIAVVAAVLLFCIWAVTATSQYITKVYHEQGGDALVVADGGAINIESGGGITIASGGTFSFGGYEFVIGRHFADNNAATDTISVTGVDSDDIVIATMNTQTMGEAYLIHARPGTNMIVLTYSADPAESVAVSYQVWKQ